MFNTEKLNELIDKDGRSIEQIAEAAGISRQQLYFLRDGSSSNPKMKTVVGLAKALNIPVEALYKEAA